MKKLKENVDAYAYGEIELKEAMANTIETSMRWVLSHKTPENMLREALTFAIGLGILTTVRADTAEEFDACANKFVDMVIEQLDLFNDMAGKVSAGYSERRKAKGIKLDKGGNE